MEDLVNNFNSDDDEVNLHNEPLSIKKEDFEMKNIIDILQSQNILKKEFICEVYSKSMKMEHNNQYIDKFIWRCHSSNPYHDIKKNIRCGSLLESIKVPLNIIYYLTFKCFLDKYSLNKTYVMNEDFCKLMKLPKTTRNTIFEIFQLLRDLIRRYYHNKWSETKL